MGRMPTSSPGHTLVEKIARRKVELRTPAILSRCTQGFLLLCAFGADATGVQPALLAARRLRPGPVLTPLTAPHTSIFTQGPVSRLAHMTTMSNTTCKTVPLQQGRVRAARGRAC